MWVMKTAFICLVLLAIIGGCRGEVEDPATLALRQKFLVASEPLNPVSLTEAAELVAADPTRTEPLTVTIVGRIHSGDLEPWEPGKASFILSELPAEGHGAGHDADNCPFCKRRAAKAPTAIVRFADDKNETLAIDARTLFGVKKGQAVVVSGQLIPGEFNSLVLTAEQIHPRKP